MKLTGHRIRIYNNFLNWRFIFLYVVVFSLFIGLVIRIAYLQLINHDMLLREGDIRSLRMQRLDISRGIIRDRVGRLLAISVPAYAICVNPKKVFENKNVDFLDKRWKILSDMLDLSLHQISSRISFKSNDNFVYLARQISKAVADRILNLQLPGIYLCLESRRYYPCAQITSHVVGVTDIDGHGIEGIEKSFDSLLAGSPGKRIVRRDPSGRIIEHIFSVKSQLADNLYLSIDERLQTLVYRELHHAVVRNKAESGNAVLIDIESGEVLAMVNSPSYNPNNLSTVVKKSIRNRVISDLFEPGSTIKPIVILAALNQGIVHKNSIIDTSSYIINGHQIKDVVHHDRLSIKEILQKSSNVGVSKLALKIPHSILVDIYLKFGIGKKTNIGLVGESNNLSFFKRHCSDIERAALSYGYGVMVTPLQLAKMYATIGGMGVSRPLSIIRQESKVIGERVFPESLVRTVVNMMDAKPLFTRYGKDINIGYRIAIKTGTVKKVGKYGRYINNYVAYTAGVAPLNNPKFALVVVINEPRSGQYYGSVVSLPIFRKMMLDILRVMDVQPDKIPSLTNNVSLTIQKNP